MRKIRVLVVDDSVVVRRILSTMLSSDPSIEVAATASGGQIALARIAEVHPDIVTLDVEMPEWDGLTSLAEIRARHPELPVIMCSTLTTRGATTALDALALGATDCIAKPTSLGGASSPDGGFRAELLAKVKGICARVLASATPARTAPPAPVAPPRPRLVPNLGVDIVAIGSSTGGPQALTALLSALPPLTVPVVVAQHMPPVFTGLFAKRLDQATHHAVAESSGDEAPTPGSVWIAPGDFHMVTRRVGAEVRLALHQAPPVNSCRPSVDVLFDSLLEPYGGRVLAVVLTGMGSDGLHGSRHIREAGGQVIVQDEATSVVWGMPGRVAEAGLADAILPLAALPAEIVRRVSRRPGFTDIPLPGLTGPAVAGTGGSRGA